MDINRGMRDKLEKYVNLSAPIDAQMSISGPGEYDFCCFGVDADDKLSDDRYMVFYNQVTSPQNEIAYSGNGNNATFKVNLNSLPASIQKLVFTVSIDGNSTMGNISNFTFSVNQNGANAINLKLSGTDFSQEKAIIAIEVYRKDSWRFNAIARGFNGGLADLLRNYGGEEASGQSAAPAAPAAPAGPSNFGQPAASPAPAAAPAGPQGPSNFGQPAASPAPAAAPAGPQGPSNFGQPAASPAPAAGPQGPTGPSNFGQPAASPAPAAAPAGPQGPTGPSNFGQPAASPAPAAAPAGPQGPGNFNQTNMNPYSGAPGTPSPAPAGPQGPTGPQGPGNFNQTNMNPYSGAPGASNSAPTGPQGPTGPGNFNQGNSGGPVGPGNFNQGPAGPGGQVGPGGFNQAAAPVQKTEKVSLAKGQKVSLTKRANSNDPIIVECGWAAAGKDYDLKALVRYRDGRQIYIGAANRDEALSTPDGAVRHGGDIKNPGELEHIFIKWDPQIASVAVSSYSAIENGTGSFNRYGVYVRIRNGNQTIEIPAKDTSANERSYTLCFGEIVFGQEKDALEAVALEMYSAPNSENRVGYRNGKVVMDIGPAGSTK